MVIKLIALGLIWGGEPHVPQLCLVEDMGLGGKLGPANQFLEREALEEGGLCDKVQTPTSRALGTGWMGWS